MITLIVDESYAFDFLSILEVKYEYKKLPQLAGSILQCKAHLKEQLKDLFDVIMQSNEYKNLYEANKNTFKVVDLAKTDDVKASDVDYSNLLRCQARNQLQEKFFSSKNSEVKFGYERYNNR